MTKALDRTDRRILKQLQENGRITNVELAEQVNLSATPCARRWRRLEEQGYIEGYTAIVDPRLSGYTVTAYAFIRLSSNGWQAAEAFETAVKKLPPVMECSVVSGSSDYLLRIVARDLQDYERFLKRELAVIDAIGTIDSTIVLNRVLNRAGLPL
jgi:Lrp/AsnC family transcriptional regulator, leucine-responsive regulatory protein